MNQHLTLTNCTQCHPLWYQYCNCDAIAKTALWYRYRDTAVSIKVLYQYDGCMHTIDNVIDSPRLYRYRYRYRIARYNTSIRYQLQVLLSISIIFIIGIKRYGIIVLSITLSWLLDTRQRYGFCICDHRGIVVLKHTRNHTMIHARRYSCAGYQTTVHTKTFSGCGPSGKLWLRICLCEKRIL